MKAILYTVIGLFSCVLVASADTHVNLRSTVDKTSAAIGEKIIYSVRFQWDQSNNQSLRVLDITAPSSDTLELVNAEQVSSSSIINNKTIAKIDYAYTFKADSIGAATIKPAIIEYVISDDLENKRYIQTNPRDIHIIPKYKRWFNLYALPLSIALLMGLIASVTIWVHKRNKIKRVREAREAEIGSEEREFLKQLSGAQYYKVSGDLKRYFDVIKGFWIQYMVDKHGLDADRLSDSKSHQYALNLGVPNDLLNLYAEWDSIHERVHFSGYKPSDVELEKLVRGMDKYFNALIPNEVEHVLNKA